MNGPTKSKKKNSTSSDLSEIKHTLNNLHARVDAKAYKLGKIDDQLEKVNGHLSEYNAQLREHMARSEALEAIVDVLQKDVKAVEADYKSIPTRLLQIVSIVGGLIVVIKQLFPKI